MGCCLCPPGCAPEGAQHLDGCGHFRREEVHSLQTSQALEIKRGAIHRGQRLAGCGDHAGREGRPLHTSSVFLESGALLKECSA